MEEKRRVFMPVGVVIVLLWGSVSYGSFGEER